MTDLFMIGQSVFALLVIAAVGGVSMAMLIDKPD